MDGAAASYFHWLHDVQTGLSLTAAEVKGEQLRWFFQQAVEGAPLLCPEIYNAAVIPNASSIGGGQVAAEHLQCWSLLNGHLAHKSKRVLG